MSNVNEKYVKEIVTDYDKLSERCMELNLGKSNKLAQEIILSLKNTIRANSDVVGLSACQVGFSERVICLNFNGDIRSFINPIITNSHGMEMSKETCHSEPGRVFIRPRFSTIEVTYQTPLGDIKTAKLAGLAARVMQHHIDHLDGLLLSDISLEIDDEFNNATPEEQEQLVKEYIDALDIAKKDIDTAIEEDAEAKQLRDAIRFTESVRNGETIAEPLDDEELKALMDSKQESEEVNNE